MKNNDKTFSETSAEVPRMRGNFSVIRSSGAQGHPVLDGLVSARATGHREPEGMNEILRDIPPRRDVLPIPEPARGSPRADGTFPETGD